MLTPNPDEPELKIEDCRLNICGCRFAPSFLKLKEYLKYSIFIRKYPNTIILPQNVVDPPLEDTKIFHKGLSPAKPEIPKLYFVFFFFGQKIRHQGRKINVIVGAFCCKITGCIQFSTMV